MSARRILKTLVFCASAAGTAYIGARFSFWMICVFGGHGYSEEIYAAWDTALFTLLWGATGAWVAITDP